MRKPNVVISNLLICCSLFGVFYDIISPKWKISSTSASKLKTLVNCEGLWVRYVIEVDGSSHYEHFEDPFFAQPGKSVDPVF